jgi:hypothetical protein
VSVHELKFACHDTFRVALDFIDMMSETPN